MNKLGIIGLSIILLLSMNTRIFADGNPNQSVPTDTIIKNIDLSKKSYYESIFNKDERKQLKKADGYIQTGKKYLLEYNTNRKEIEMLYTIAEATTSAKSREKSLSKARKMEQKSLKTGKKALDNYKKGTDIKSKIYTSAINRIRLNDNSKQAQLGREFELQAKSAYDKAKTTERMAPQHDDLLNFNALNDANNLTIKALNLQENAFALYKNDPQINPDDYLVQPKQEIITNVIKKDTGKVVVVDSVLFPVYVEQYNPLTDKNLYKSKADIILPRLNLSGPELASLSESNRKNQYANELLRQVDETYVIVDSLNFVADRTPDFSTRDRIRNMAIEKEQSAFYKLTNATNIHLDVNETRYKIYKAHFPTIDPKKMNPELELAGKYKNEADESYLKAKNEIAIASKQMYRSEQYIQLMGANDMLLYALQLQESAYGIYFNIPEAITERPDTALVSKNKTNKGIATSEKEKTSKNLSWDVSSTLTYSKEKPKAVPYKVKKGVVFLVQLGIFKGILPAEKFGNIQPVVFDEFSKNPNRRFMVGEYRSVEAAESALDFVKKNGYPDAYIIALVDGQRKSLADARSIVNTNDDHYNYLKRSEMAKISGDKNFPVDKVVDETPKTGQVSGTDIKKTKGLVYLVQLGMYSKPITYSELKGLQPIYTDKIEGKGTRYMMGTYNSLSKAREESQRAVNKGMEGAYVIAYNNGKNVSLDVAKKIEGKQGNLTEENIVVPSGNIVFMVQVGAYKEKLNAQEENKLQTSYAPRNIETKISDGMNVYLVGNYKTYKEADFLKKKLVSEGHEGVFVVAFKGDQKISVADAIKMNK